MGYNDNGLYSTPAEVAAAIAVHAALTATHGAATAIADTGDARFPTADQKAALAGTSGSPAAGNLYVTNADSRNTDARNPVAHKTSHQNGGGDEISVLGLSGLLGDSQTPLSHKASHQNAGLDEINVAGLSGELADDQPPKAHDFGGSKHTQDTTADVNAKLSDGEIMLVHASGVKYFSGERTGFTPEGGIAVLLTNKTGAASVKGTMVEASAGTDNAVDILSANAIDVVGPSTIPGLLTGPMCGSLSVGGLRFFSKTAQRVPEITGLGCPPARPVG